MALIGARCLGDFNYYMSFGIMVCLPLAILFMALVNYYGTSRVLKHRLRTMTKEQKIVKQTEALHELFELADSDHSGYVEPIELTEILHSLGWSIKSKQLQHWRTNWGQKSPICSPNVPPISTTMILAI